MQNRILFASADFNYSRADGYFCRDSFLINPKTGPQNSHFKISGNHAKWSCMIRLNGKKSIPRHPDIPMICSKWRKIGEAGIGLKKNYRSIRQGILFRIISRKDLNHGGSILFSETEN